LQVVYKEKTCAESAHGHHTYRCFSLLAACINFTASRKSPPVSASRKRTHKNAPKNVNAGRKGYRPRMLNDASVLSAVRGRPHYESLLPVLMEPICVLLKLIICRYSSSVGHRLLSRQYRSMP